MQSSTKLMLAALIVAGSLNSVAADRTSAKTLSSAKIDACDRACLKALLDTYVAGMTAHDPSRLPTAASVKFTENGKVMAIGDGFWKTAGRLRYRVDVLDPQSQSAAMQATFEENGEPVIYFVRLKMAARKVTEIETILVRKGDLELFAPDRLEVVPASFIKPIPKGQRATRAQLIAAADAYFEAFDTGGTPQYKRPPVTHKTLRIENGAQTVNPTVGSGNTAVEQLDKAIFKGNIVTDRRYPVVDVEHGTVMGLVVFRAAPGYAVRGGRFPKDLLLMEFFRVEQGKITEIHAVMNEIPKGSPTGWNSP